MCFAPLTEERAMDVREEYFDAEGAAHYTATNMVYSLIFGCLLVAGSLAILASNTGGAIDTILIGSGGLLLGVLSLGLSYRLVDKRLSFAVTASYLLAMHPGIQHYPIRP
jgi:hypothetical protein